MRGLVLLAFFALVVFQYVRTTERRKRREQDRIRIPKARKVNMTIENGGALSMHNTVSRVFDGEQVFWAEKV